MDPVASNPSVAKSSKSSKSKSSSKGRSKSNKSRSNRKNNTTKKQRVRKRCGNCPACLRPDCGKCDECQKKKKFGGNGLSKQACRERRCDLLAELKRERKRRRARRRREKGGASGEFGDDLSDNSDDDSDDDDNNDDDMESLESFTTTNTAGKKRAASSASVTSKSKKRKNNNPTTASKSSFKTSAAASATPATVDEANGTDPALPLLDPIVVQLQENYPLSPSKSLLASNQVLETKSYPSSKDDDSRDRTTRLLADYKYGRPVLEPAQEMCAGCRRTQGPNATAAGVVCDKHGIPTAQQQEQQPVILLCDGPNCQTEYHLECCIPPIADVPEGAYYCVDCNPYGSSAILEQYLEDHDDRRALELSLHTSAGGVSGALGFLTSLWKEDLEDNQDNWGEEKQVTTGSVSTQRVPQSELARLLDLEQHLMGGTTSNGATLQSGKPSTFAELGNLFLGKPVRLYCPLDDNYHSGRIVDYRAIPDDLHKMSCGMGISPKKTTSKNATSTAAASTSAADNRIYCPNDDFFATKIEFLVRFVPGSDEYRKTLIYRWIRLEEHSLAVGTHIVWGKYASTAAAVAVAAMNNGTPTTQNNGTAPTNSASPQAAVNGAATTATSSWQPALLFLRTSRELMPVLHLLQEEEGEISYHPATLMTQGSGGISSKSKKGSSSPGAQNNLGFATTIPKKSPGMVWALAKRLASSTNATATAVGGADPPPADPDQSQAYKLLRIAHDARNVFSRKPTASHLDQLKYSLAMAEHNEQAAVAEWRHFPLRKKGALYAMRSRDALALGPLDYHTKKNKSNNKVPTDEEELCPLIRPPGLDRSYLLKRLLQRGVAVEANKDTAAEMECWLIP